MLVFLSHPFFEEGSVTFIECLCEQVVNGLMGPYINDLLHWFLWVISLVIGNRTPFVTSDGFQLIVASEIISTH